MGNKGKGLKMLALLLPLLVSACQTVDVSGLVSNRESVNERFNQSMEWNANHPFREIVLSGDDYTLLAISDTHVGDPELLDSFFRVSATINPAAIAMVGDLTTGHQEDYEVFEAHLPDPEALPWFPIAGNHDIYFDGWKQFIQRLGSSTYLFTVKTPVAKDLFLCLETASATLGRDQMEWLKSILEDIRSDFRHCVIFTHGNLFRVRHVATTNPNVEELQELMSLCLDYNINLVVAGHDHLASDEMLGNTRHMNLPALLEGKLGPGYLRVDFLNGNLNADFQAL